MKKRREAIKKEAEGIEQLEVKNANEMLELDEKRRPLEKENRGLSRQKQKAEAEDVRRAQSWRW